MDKQTARRRETAPAKTLERLRALIPPMPLCDHCGDCCGGNLVANEEEWHQIQGYAQDHHLSYRFYGDYTCGWYDREAKGCSIYLVRPLLCRMFGAVRQHACAKVPGVATVDLSTEMLDARYCGPWYRLNGRPLGPVESEWPWSELLQPYLELRPSE